MPFITLDRRSLLKRAASAAIATLPAARLLAQTAPPPVTKVLVVFKCHLDVGFTETQAKVMRKYFDVYYPAAIERAASLRKTNGDRYTWTTGSWLLYEYLEQATPAQRIAMEQAVTSGDISYHALPFSWQSEMLDPSIITGALGLATDLDRRFGRHTIGAKMTDVPGHTRGLIAPLASGGIRLLDIGVNAASFPPSVPDIFVWKDSAGNELVMLYHRHDYGGTLQIPNSPLAVSVEVRNDNSGPHTLEEIAVIYARLRAQFPEATVQPVGLTEVALAIEPYRSQLPIFTQEIGDTWIYGTPSDPLKVARYRETARFRQGCLARHAFTSGDTTDRELLRHLLLSVEHTWGTDTKSYLDNDHYRPADLAKVLSQPAYQTMLTSWQEKRDDLDAAIATLPPSLRAEANERLTSLIPTAPSTEGLTSFDLTKPLDTKHFTLAFDPITGAISALTSKRTGHSHATPNNPLALFTYQTLSSPDFASFLDRYIQIKADWAPRDFGKPGIETFGTVSRDWHPRVQQSWHARTPTADRMILHLRIDDPAAQATGNVAWPAEIYLEATFPNAEPTFHLTLTTHDKADNRLPEAMWLTFAPPAIDPTRSTVNKVAETIALSGVTRGGGRNMHAIHDRVTLAGKEQAPRNPHLGRPRRSLGAAHPP